MLPNLKKFLRHILTVMCITCRDVFTLFPFGNTLVNASKIFVKQSVQKEYNLTM